MLPRKNLLLSFATLATALLFVAPVDIVAQSSNATCLPGPAYGWLNNSMNQSPCQVAAYLISVCDAAPFVVPALQPTYRYTVNRQNMCSCSTITYSAFSACAFCQNATQTNWNQWNLSCSASKYQPFYPPGIPSGTAVPYWMFQDVTLTNMFNMTLAQSVSDFPESTAGQAQSSVPNSATATGTSASLVAAPIGTAAGISASSTAKPSQTSTSPKTPTSAPGSGSGGGSNSNSKIGVIVGAVVGGVVGLLAIVGLAAFFLVKNKKHSEVPMVEHIPSAIYTDGTSSGLPDVVRP